MRQLLEAALQKSPEQVSVYTPDPNTIAMSLQYKHGIILELTKTADKQVAKAVEVIAGDQGRQVAHLRAHSVLTEAEDLERAEGLWKENFGSFQQEAKCEHFALLILGKKPELKANK